MRGVAPLTHHALMTDTQQRNERAASTAELIALGRDREAVEAATRDSRSRPAQSRPERLPSSRPGETAMTSTLTDPAIQAIKARQQATWASGDYAVIGTALQIVGESLCEAVDLAAGWRVLDVAAGNGNAALAAARRGCTVTATDYVEGLLDGAHRRAEANGLALEIRAADAEDLPFDNGAFDAVLSTFGVMFVPDPQRAAAELVRVCRPGGRIGLANWTPTGFVGQMFKIVGRHVPPPPGLRSPLEWGTEARLTELFDGVARLEVQPRRFVFRYRSWQHWLDTFRTYYGPMFKAFAGLDDQSRKELQQELLDLAEASNTSTNGTLRIPADYLEVVAVTAA
jgi:SAM-dependent methyltransferase